MSESDNYVASGDDGKHLKFLEEVMELRGEIHHLENSPTPDIALVKRLWNDNNGKKAPFFYTTNCCVCVCMKVYQLSDVMEIFMDSSQGCFVCYC